MRIYKQRTTKGGSGEVFLGKEYLSWTLKDEQELPQWEMPGEDRKFQEMFLCSFFEDKCFFVPPLGKYRLLCLYIIAYS